MGPICPHEIGKGVGKRRHGGVGGGASPAPRALAWAIAAPSRLTWVAPRTVAQVRDMGFNAIIIGKGLLDVCVRDRVPPAAVIKAMNSKGSVKFGLGMQKGRLEGSKENLGTIAM